MSKNAIAHIIEGATIVVLSLFLFKECHRPTETITIPVEVRDTIRIEKERIVQKTNIEYVTVFDTVVKNDTIEIPVKLPIEHCLYQDTLKTDTTEVEVAIKYSGFKPSLDSVGISYHFLGEKAVEVPKNASHSHRLCLTAGVYAGYSPIYNNFDVIFGVGGSIRLY